MLDLLLKQGLYQKYFQSNVSVLELISIHFGGIIPTEPIRGGCYDWMFWLKMNLTSGAYLPTNYQLVILVGLCHIVVHNN